MIKEDSPKSKHSLEMIRRWKAPSYREKVIKGQKEALLARERLALDDSELRELYEVQLLNIQQVADKCNISYTVALKHLKRLGLIRGISENNKLSWQRHPERRKNLSKRLAGRPFSEDHKMKISKALTGKKHSQIHCTNVANALREKKQPKEVNEKRRKTMKKHWQDPEYREKNLKKMIAGSKREDTRKKHSKTTKRLWQEPNYRAKVIKAALKGLFKRPTSFEQRVLDVIQKHNLPFDYVGDGEVLINYVNPDFINNNGEKLLIEVANRVELHHPKGYEVHRAKRFAKYGFKTLFLRDEDILRDDWAPHILNRIEGFMHENCNGGLQ